jgi:hypothetical protein
MGRGDLDARTWRQILAEPEPPAGLLVERRWLDARAFAHANPGGLAAPT